MNYREIATCPHSGLGLELGGEEGTNMNGLLLMLCFPFEPGRKVCLFKPVGFVPWLLVGAGAPQEGLHFVCSGHRAMSYEVPSAINCIMHN